MTIDSAIFEINRRVKAEKLPGSSLTDEGADSLVKAVKILEKIKMGLSDGHYKINSKLKELINSSLYADKIANQLLRK